MFDPQYLLQTWIEKAKHTSDILAGIQILSYGDYVEAAQQAKARLKGFQQQQAPRMTLPNSVR